MTSSKRELGGEIHTEESINSEKKLKTRETAGEENLATLTVAQLKDRCRANGLLVSGTKAQLLERLSQGEPGNLGGAPTHARATPAKEVQALQGAGINGADIENIDSKENMQNVDIILDTGVPGLFLVQNFLSPKEETELLANIERHPWKPNRTKTRRIQMFGPHHTENYKVLEGCEISPLPIYSKALTDKLHIITSTHFPQFDLSSYNMGIDEYTELFVNEYLPENGLQFHFDHNRTYKDVIFGISLLCDSDFYFKKGDDEAKVFLPARSLYLMTGDARRKWQHGMHPFSLKGARRVSLTYRMVNYTK